MAAIDVRRLVLVGATGAKDAAATVGAVVLLLTLAARALALLQLVVERLSSIQLPYLLEDV